MHSKKFVENDENGFIEKSNEISIFSQRYKDLLCKQIVGKQMKNLVQFMAVGKLKNVMQKAKSTHGNTTVNHIFLAIHTNSIAPMLFVGITCVIT